jgi:branched-chain amino acid transport system permease protein
MMMGMGGQMSFATISFMGIGAFTATRLCKNMGLSPVISILLSICVVMAVSWLIGLVLFRLSGAYFTFATIGLVQIVSNVLTNYKPFSGGPDGITGIPKLTIAGYTFQNLYSWFYLLAGAALCCGLIVERIRKTSLGRSLASVRDNEIAAKTLGVDTYRVKIISFVIAGAFAGLSGSLIAFHNSSISASLFSFNTSTLFVVMVMLGGVNSTVGTFVGTLLVTLLPEWLRPLTEYMRLINGVGIILLMIFMPMGLAGLLQNAKAAAKKIWRK